LQIIQSVQTQQEISGYNGGLPGPQRMRFRIGIHLGMASSQVLTMRPSWRSISVAAEERR
jgi:hypothetical protein